MVFPSIPGYLDPANWHQQQSHQIIGSSNSNPLLPPQPQPPPLTQQTAPPLPPPHGGGGSSGSGTIRPGSMAERARMANIPMPEISLKCPRCESINTKFCYFNNYSLSQPRHFCKTCRRYWTRGGALRSVPVGGGCRRNKRSKSNSSKSPASGDRQTTNSSSTTSTISSNSATPAAVVPNLLGLGSTPQLPSPLRFMSPLSQLTDNFNTSHDMASLINNYSGISSPAVGTTNEMNFQLGSGSLFGSSSGGGVASLLLSGGGGGGGGGIEQWRLQQVQQFPFLGGLDPSAQGIYNPFQGNETGFVSGESSQDQHEHHHHHHHQVRPKLSSSMLTQMASVKIEENPAELNLSRQLMGGIIPRNHQWNNNATAGGVNWSSDQISSFGSFSTSNQL